MTLLFIISLLLIKCDWVNLSTVLVIASLTNTIALLKIKNKSSGLIKPPILVKNDTVMTLWWHHNDMTKIGLSLNSQKSLTLDNIFDFVVSESCDGGVSYSNDKWLLILLFLFFTFAIDWNLLIPMKKEHKPWPPLLPPSLVRNKRISHHRHLWQQTQSAIMAAISLVAAHFGCCSCTDGFPPQATMLAGLIVARGREVAI